MNYQVLLRLLDGLRTEAPISYKSYRPRKSDQDKLNAARAKAFIHMFLKARLGLVDFEERHDCITEGSGDGGIDAYYLDQENKQLYLIQSKFRTTEQNFRVRRMTADDLVKMEIKMILSGEERDSNGNRFNSKIREFQKRWAALSDQARYGIKVIILGNIHKYSLAQMKRLVDNFDFEIFDHQRTYKELLLPLCSSTYYKPEEIVIQIDLDGGHQHILTRSITTTAGQLDVRLVFVPTSEIGRIMYTYRNAILMHNPRNYLSLSNSAVNRKIKDSLCKLGTNEFAILNNGITMLADQCRFSEAVGRVNKGQLVISNPQIINGGQTACVLSELNSDSDEFSSHVGKEVLLKVISKNTQKKGLETNFVERLSEATNQQTAVKEADRRSNDSIQINLQDLIFNLFGRFYERKSGEFYDSIASGYIDKKWLVNRGKFLRAYLAYRGRPAQARGASEATLFEENKFKDVLRNVKHFRRMFFAYLLLIELGTLSRKKSGKTAWGNGLRYGKLAIVAAVGRLKPQIGKTLKEINDEAISQISHLRSRWKKFERHVSSLNRNREYKSGRSLDFDNYYKGRTLDKDIKAYFKKGT